MRGLLCLCLALLACTPKETDDHVPCKAPGGCSAVLSTLGTDDASVTLIGDGVGGAYAAILGAGPFPVCSPSAVCHGELWRISATGDVLWKVSERKSVDQPFRIPGGVAYRTGDGRIEAVDSEGNRMWRREKGDGLLAASTVFNTVVVVGAGQVERLDPGTGLPIWFVPFAVTFPVVPVRTGEREILVMGRTDASTVVARGLDPDTGATRWEATLPAELSPPAYVARVPFGPTLLVSDRLSLRDGAGAEIWRYDGVDGFRHVRAAADGGFIASGPILDTVTRFRADGTVLWFTPAPGGPVVWLSAAPDGQVLLGQQDGVIRKLNEQSGVTLWSYGGVASVKATAPPVFTSKGNAVFYGANVGEASDTSLTTVTPAGQGLDRWDAGSRIVSITLSNDDDVFISTLDGRIHLRRAADL